MSGYIIPRDKPCCLGGQIRYKNCVRHEFLEEYEDRRVSLRSFKKLPVTVCYTGGVTEAQMEADREETNITWQLEKIVDEVVQQRDQLAALLKHNIVELRLMGFYLLLLGITRGKDLDKSKAIISSTRKFLDNMEKAGSPVSAQCIVDVSTILQRAIDKTGFTDADVTADSEYDQYLLT